jgi:hypothetical protein
MVRDIRFEAAFLRDAILVGLVHERVVEEWATQLLSTDGHSARALAEVLSVPMQLSPIREALRAFGEPARPLDVTAALLACAALDPTHRGAGVAHVLRVLSSIRRLAGCPPGWSNAIADFELKAMLASEIQPSSSIASDVLSWLDDVRPPVHFLVPFRERHEAAAFVAALSRAMAIDGARGQATLADVDAQSWTIGLDETAWVLAGSRVDPLPVAARVPYPGSAPGRVLIHQDAPDVSAESIQARLT